LNIDSNGDQKKEKQHKNTKKHFKTTKKQVQKNMFLLSLQTFLVLIPDDKTSWSTIRWPEWLYQPKLAWQKVPSQGVYKSNLSNIQSTSYRTHFNQFQ